MPSVTNEFAHKSPAVWPSRIIAFAITTKERIRFFGDEPIEFEGWQIIFPATVSDSVSWDRVIALAPSIVVTGWSTPPIPLEWVTSPECSLRYVCNVTGSVRRHIPRIFLQRGGLVTNWGSLAAPMVAEHAVLLALAALRNLPAWSEYIAMDPSGRDAGHIKTRTLTDRRVGIHGFGRVARHLVELLRPFGVAIRAYSAGVPDFYFSSQGVEPALSLGEIMSWSEVFFECEALTESTYRSVTAELISALPVGAVFVNVGRGNLVDQSALMAAARSGRLRLGLDVTSDEPLTPKSPILSIPGAVISPHIAGPTADFYPQLGCYARENIRRILSGQRSEALVTLAEYDRGT